MTVVRSNARMFAVRLRPNTAFQFSEWVRGGNHWFRVETTVRPFMSVAFHDATGTVTLDDFKQAVAEAIAELNT